MAAKPAVRLPVDPPVDEELVSPREALVFGVLAVWVIRTFVPFGGTILYPFTLFGTWVHEMGHGLTGLMVGGSFDRLEIFGDASGLAYGSVAPGLPAALRAAGGLLGPPILGACILAASRGPRRAMVVLTTLAAIMLLSVPIWVRSLTGWIAIPVVALVIAAVALRGGPVVRTIFAQSIGVLLGLDTVTRIDYLFSSSATIGGEVRPSDVESIANQLGLHYLVWGSLLAALSLAFVFVGVRLAWAKPFKLRRGPGRGDEGGKVGPAAPAADRARAADRSTGR